MEEFAISTDDPTEQMLFYNPELSRGRVTACWCRLVKPNFSVSTYLNEDYCESLSELPSFFRQMADDWKGWPGERHWSHAESKLELKCRNEGISHVAMDLTMRSDWGVNEWSLKSLISIELGQLERIARQAGRFFLLHPPE